MIKAEAGAARDMLFVSHANPEDNECSLWLALQLAKEGYPVWCDLTKLLGGEDFWEDIEKALRQRTVKFLYVLSRTSNHKPGPLKELYLAESIQRANKLEDFVIPLLFDDLPFSDFNIQIARLNAIPFNRSWSFGLSQLLRKLEKDQVQKKSNFKPEAVSSWWRSQHNSNKGVVPVPEVCLSNWFPISSIPKVNLHIIHSSGFAKPEIQAELPFPSLLHGDRLISFAAANDLEPFLGPSNLIVTSDSFAISDLVQGKTDPELIDPREAKHHVYRLLKEAWYKFATHRGLSKYEMAANAPCFFFRKGLMEGDKIFFSGVDGKQTHRSIVGYKTTKKTTGEMAATKRFWHFAVQLRPQLYPAQAFQVKGHVVFSDDGTVIWDSKANIHRARRSQCKNWWNDDWRDRILATMSWLARPDNTISMQVGNGINVEVSSLPIEFESPVSCEQPPVLDDSIECFEDEDLDDEEQDGLD